MEKNISHAFVVSLSALLVILMTVSISMADSFGMDEKLEKLYDNATWIESTTLVTSSGNKGHLFSGISDSFVKESDFERNPMDNRIVLTEGKSIAALNQGDSFFNKSDQLILSNCRIDKNSESMGFMVCNVK